MDTQIDDLRDSLPVLDDDSPDGQQAQNEPMLAVEKSGRRLVVKALAFLLMVIVGGVLIFQMLFRSHVETTLSSATSQQSDIHTPDPYLLPDSVSEYDIQVSSGVIASDIEARLSEMDSRLVRLDSFVEQMAAHLDQQSSLLIDLQTGLAEQDEVVAAIEASHQELRKTLLQQTQARVQAQAKPPATKTPTASFDLRISSVRHLGRSTGVMVRSSDHSQFLAVGQEVNGWRLVSADAQRLHAEFIHTSGQRHEVQL